MTTMTYWIAGILVMALVTYIPRVLPLTLMRKKVESPFVRSFLFYMPYAVLGAMTFPAILYSTATPWSALAGLIVALLLAFFRKGLLIVALSSTAAVLLTEYFLHIV